MEESSKSLFSNWIYTAIFDAIENGTGIQIHYQPIVGLDNQQVHYYEAQILVLDFLYNQYRIYRQLNF